MFDDLKTVHEEDKDNKIDHIIRSMAYGPPFEYNFQDLFGRHDVGSTSYYYLLLYQVHDEMVHEELIKSRVDESAVGDKSYIVSLAVKGGRIKNKGGWLKHKKRERNKIILDRFIFYSTFVLAGLSVLVPMYCSGPRDKQPDKETPEQISKTLLELKHDSVPKIHPMDTAKKIQLDSAKNSSNQPSKPN